MILNCSNDNITCLLSECWNGSESVAVIVKVPTFVPVPVEVNPDNFPLVNLFREKRDFGITAAIITAIAVSAAAATTAALAMTNQVQTAQTINQVIQQTAQVLESQDRVNRHILSGILAANQRIDLLQVQLDELFNIAQVGCIGNHKHMCITPVRYEEAKNQSHLISAFLAGNWSLEAEKMMNQQLLQIAILNDTRVEPVTLSQFSSWLTSAFSYFKEWVGVGIFGCICFAGICLCLWFICKLRVRQAREKAVLIQAVLAIEQGVSPSVWLANLARE